MSSQPGIKVQNVEGLLSEAIDLFKRGDLKWALHFLKAYLAHGGQNADEAQSYVRQIGTLAIAAAKRLHQKTLFRSARENYELALKTGTHSEDAESGLRSMPIRTMMEFRSAHGGPGSATGAANLRSEERLWRRPHMDLSKEMPLAAGDTFEINIHCDQSEPRPGEQIDDINLPNISGAYDLEVHLLTSAHFRVVGPSIKPFHIERSKIESEVVPFSVTVVNAADLEAVVDQPASICAAFRYEGRPAGRVLRQLDIAGATSFQKPEAVGSKGTVVVELGAKAADLTVTIQAQMEQNDNRHFWCTVQTNLLPQYRNGLTEQWVTNDVTNRIVGGYMQAFTEAGLEPFVRLARLVAAGKQLFQAAPPVFQKAFWTLIDADVKFKTIAIVSSEPYIPWELMIPNRPGPADCPAEARDALGVEFCIGRTTRSSGVTGSQKIKLDECYVVAPVFEGPNSLPKAQEERTMVLEKIHGDAIDPSDVKTLNEKLATCRGLLHFACHGEITDIGQKLYLGEDTYISALDLAGLPGPTKGIRAARPLVFLNACKVGQTNPALVGVGGFAPALMELGAGAVIAPLWSVKDTIAHDFAVDFYNVLQSNSGLAEIVRIERKKAYETGEDTYAAYCFYGDPLATRA
jgi:hypothetical protein